MKAVTIRDVRPSLEKALAREGEILITRDAKPVAKLVRVDPAVESRARFESIVRMILGSLRNAPISDTTAPLAPQLSRLGIDRRTVRAKVDRRLLEELRGTTPQR